MRFGFGIRPKSIIHVGAHKGQGRTDYEKLGVENFFWFEALPDLAIQLREKFPQDTVFQGIAWNQPDLLLEFHEMAQSENSSVLASTPESLHVPKGTPLLRTLTLDKSLEGELIDSNAMLVLDVQGAELNVLVGSTSILNRVRYIVCEIGITNQGYYDVPTERELATLLCSSGFKKSICRISKNESYFDQLFIKTSTSKIVWICAVDKLYDLALRAFHLVSRGHFQRYHYHCQRCGY